MANHDQDRLLPLAASVLSRLLELDPGDQLDVLALTAAAWCYARDHPEA